MKPLPTSLAALFFFALGSNANCVNGFREHVNPGSTYEHKCDVYYPGVRHDNIASTKDCALLCEANKKRYCSYNTALKRCVVGNDGAAETPSVGVTLLTKVDNYEEDPWATKCEDTLEDLKKKLADTKSELDQCNLREKDLQQKVEDLNKAPTPHDTAIECPGNNNSVVLSSKGKKWSVYCGRYHGLSGVIATKDSLSATNCWKICDDVPECFFAVWKGDIRKCVLSSTQDRRVPGRINADWVTVIRAD